MTRGVLIVLWFGFIAAVVKALVHAARHLPVPGWDMMVLCICGLFAIIASEPEWRRKR